MLRGFAISMVLASGVAGVAQAQQAPVGAPISPALMEEMRAAQARYNLMPDTPGSGSYAAIKEEDRSLPDHVIYRPADLAKVGPKKLAILAWGNGGCSDDGAGARLHLLEIASHGYLAIAPGTVKSGPGAPPQPPMEMPKPGPNGERVLPPPKTSAAQLTQAIDWAIAENGRKGSPYYGKIDTGAIAVSGWSCGGLQALSIATSDPRITTVVIHNSGIFPQPLPFLGVNLGKDALDRLHSPIIYILGGPTDIAYPNGMDDFARITKVPAIAANLDRGHAGTFLNPNGGQAATIALGWLDWRLKGDTKAARLFEGKDCGLCTDASVKLLRKGIK